MNREALGALAATLAMMANASCPARPVRIGLAFENDWRVGRQTLTMPEQAGVKAAALQTLQHAFRGFDVIAREGRHADRLVIVDTASWLDLVRLANRRQSVRPSRSQS